MLSFRQVTRQRLGQDVDAWAGVLNLRRPLPSDEVQREFVGSSGVAAFRQSVAAYSHFMYEAALLGFKPGNHTRLLDFGSGWGRFSWTAMRDFDPCNIYSADVQDKALAHCRASHLPTNLVKVSTPPAPIESGSIDIVISFSVFSHLNEQAHWAWLEDLHRVLKPGGVLLLTTRNRRFIEWIAELNAKDASSDVPRASLLAIHGAEIAMLRHYDSGLFVFRDTQAIGQLAGFFGEACIPEAYIRQRWSRLFKTMRFREALDPTHTPYQALIVAQKPH